jgi:RNA recognition motif-containing protein
MAAPNAQTPASNTVKVFVGNLSFKTREDQLAQEFSAVSKVLQANIITRGPRSLGYGFVEFANEEEAKKAVNAMNKKTIDGRDINVEIAKPRAEGAEGGERPARGGFRGGFRGGRGRRGAPAGGSGERAERQEFAGGDSAPRPRGRGGFRGGRPRGARGGAGAGGSEERGPRTPSATTLFVANLPFSVDDAGLRDLFKDFAPVSAHVVIKRNGRSKGFGFVEFRGSDDQQKALTATDGKDVQGRPLIVRVAQVDEKRDAQSQEQK